MLRREKKLQEGEKNIEEIQHNILKSKTKTSILKFDTNTKHTQIRTNNR